MRTLSEVMAGLAATLQSTLSLTIEDHVPGSPVVPGGFLVITSMTEGSFGRGSMDLEIDAVILTPTTNALTGQHSLYLLVDPAAGLWTALDGEAKQLGLDDTVDARFGTFRSLGIEEIAAYGYYGGAVQVKVFVS